MASPIELIAAGLKNQDWVAIADAYEKLTGERVIVQAAGVAKKKSGKAARTRPVPDTDPDDEDDEDDESVTAGRVDINAFRVKHGSKGDGKPGHFLPFEPPKKNLFKDNSKVAVADSKLDRKLNKGLKPSGRRPPVKEVAVRCQRCNRKEMVAADLAPKTVARGEQMTYICNSCLSRGGRD